MQDRVEISTFSKEDNTHTDFWKHNEALQQRCRKEIVSGGGHVLRVTFEPRRLYGDGRKSGGPWPPWPPRFRRLCTVLGPFNSWLY